MSLEIHAAVPKTPLKKDKKRKSPVKRHTESSSSGSEHFTIRQRFNQRPENTVLHKRQATASPCEEYRIFESMFSCEARQAAVQFMALLEAADSMKRTHCRHSFHSLRGDEDSSQRCGGLCCGGSGGGDVFCVMVTVYCRRAHFRFIF